MAKLPRVIYLMVFLRKRLTLLENRWGQKVYTRWLSNWLLNFEALRALKGPGCMV